VKFILLFLFLSQLASANDSERIATDADFSERNLKTQTLYLKGNANITYKDYHLVCDEATLYQKTNDLNCVGNVTIKSPLSTIQGDRALFNLKTKKAGTVRSGQILLDAEEIIKTEEPQTYEAKNAYLTTCLSCPAAWSLKSKSIKATLNKYAELKQPYFNILGFPIIWLPYLGVPLNTKRKTGFLFPKFFSSSHTGFGFLFPFFWAINRSQDITLTTGYYWERKGPHMLLNYRYSYGPRSEGNLRFGYLRDRFDDRPDHRWFFNFNQVYQLPKNFSFFMNLQLTEDNFYLRDFPRHLEVLGQPSLDNRISLTKNTEKWHLNIDTSYNVSLLEKEIRTDDQFGLHRFPSLSFRTKSLRLLKKYPFTFQYKANYLNVGRQGPAFDTVNLCDSDRCIGTRNAPTGFNYWDPSTQTGDLIRTGQRIDNQLIFSSPFWIGPWLDIDPKLTAQWTQYALGVPSNIDQEYDALPSRSLIKTEVNLRTFLTKRYQRPNDTEIKHTIIPRIHYQYVPFFNQTNHRFFGTVDRLSAFREAQPVDDSDINIAEGGRGLQFDFNDRIVGRHLIRFGLINRINRKKARTYSQMLRFDLSQAFDIREAQRQGGFPWQEIRADINLRLRPVSISGWAEHFPHHKVTNMALRSTWNLSRRASFLLNYQLNTPITQDPKDIDIFSRTDSIDFGLTFGIRAFRITGMGFYSPRGDTIETPMGPVSEARFRRWTVTFDLTPPGRCWRLQGFLGKVLGSEDTQRKIQAEIIF